jgi:galactose mutarotase-like enzyme
MILQLEVQKVKIDSGELVSYRVNDQEYMHQKGNPGWRNVDTEMFPIIGPTAEVQFQVQTPNGIAVQDQHGLLRELIYELVLQTDTEAIFKKNYSARTPIENSKYPKKSNQQFLNWPYDFEFEKKFKLTEDGLEISFTISGERDTPFMLGYHPAFNLVTKHPIVITNKKAITVNEVIAVGSKAYQVSNCEAIILKDKNELRIETEGFGNFMLWTEVPNMICIEPITFYPYEVEQKNLHEGFLYLKDASKVFKVQLSVTDY